jgi:hypothetical protein
MSDTDNLSQDEGTGGNGPGAVLTLGTEITGGTLAIETIDDY